MIAKTNKFVLNTPENTRKLFPSEFVVYVQLESHFKSSRSDFHLRTVRSPFWWFSPLKLGLSWLICEITWCVAQHLCLWPTQHQISTGTHTYVLWQSAQVAKPPQNHLKMCVWWVLISTNFHKFPLISDNLVSYTPKYVAKRSQNTTQLFRGTTGTQMYDKLMIYP